MTAPSKDARPDVPDFMAAIRRQLDEEALLRSADAVPGADLEYLTCWVAEAIDNFTTARRQLRMARTPELAETSHRQPPHPDDEALRLADYLQARKELFTAAHRLAERAREGG